MNKFKKTLIIVVSFFAILPLGKTQLTVQGLVHIQGEATLHLQDDLVIQTSEGVIENSGTIVMEGSLEKEVVATLNTNPSGVGERRINLVGKANNQRITGDFTDDKGFYNLIVQKNSGLVELMNDIDIKNQLNLVTGKIRTDISSGSQASDYAYEVFVDNTAPDAVIANEGFIEGNLRRGVTGTNRYVFPIGQSTSEIFSIDFTNSANSSEVTASFENRTTTPSGSEIECEENNLANIDCVMGQWLVQGNGENDNYNITFAPSSSLRANCPNATAYLVAKDGQINCPAVTDMTNGISRMGLTGFGIFDIPTLNTEMMACGLVNPTATYLGGRRSRIEWPDISGVVRYRIQIRFKGMDRWLVTAIIRQSGVSVFAPMNRTYEYRIQTICADGESSYTSVLEWSTTEGDGLILAGSRNKDKLEADIVIEDNVLLSFEAFPNPANNFLQVAYTPASENAILQINHISGQIVKTFKLSQNQSTHRVNLDDMFEGAYFLTILERGKGSKTKRIIKSFDK